MGKRSTQIRVAGLIAVFAALASASPVLAQAGSTGGIIGKQDKSVSGGEELTRPHHAAPATKREKITAATVNDAGPRDTKEASCANKIVGLKWSSWASGLFGAGDTTFYSNRTALHSSGITGIWRCDGKEFVLKWSTTDWGHLVVSADGKQMADPTTGKVWFTR